jgi:putative transposase
MSPGQVALAQKVSRMAVWKIWQKYKKYGEIGLKSHRPGRLFEPLSAKFYDKVVQEWKRQRCGARKLHAILKRRGFGVSLRKISQVLKAEGFQRPNKRKQKPRKYKRYEWPLPNFMWHTDWHKIKAEKMRDVDIIIYLDDCSRKVVGYGTGAMTTRNSLLALYGAIARHEVSPHLLNSDRGPQFFPTKKGKEGNAFHEFQQALEELGILFIPSRRRHPQTNGKLEKFFHVLDSEFDDRFMTLDEFINWYNTERASEAVDYMTPQEAYDKRL